MDFQNEIVENVSKAMCMICYNNNLLCYTLQCCVEYEILIGLGRFSPPSDPKIPKQLFNSGVIVLD